jgi:hypothetical protein
VAHSVSQAASLTEQSLSYNWLTQLPQLQASFESLNETLSVVDKNADKSADQAYIFGPISSLITSITKKDNYIAAQNAVSYLQSNPNLQKLINRQELKKEILESIDQERENILK